MTQRESSEGWDHSPVAVRMIRKLRRDGVGAVASQLFDTGVDRGLKPFDRKWGTDTSTLVHAEELAAELGTTPDEAGAHYVPIVARALYKALQQVAPNPEGTFVDIGAGSGRVIIAARDHGYRTVAGIEHSKVLCDWAIDNVRISGLDGIDVVHGDATTWPLPTDTSLVFIYNTFNPAMWAAFLDGPILDMGRPMQVLTVNMPQSLVGTDKVSVRIERTMRIGGRDFHLLEAAAITARTP